MCVFLLETAGIYFYTYVQDTSWIGELCALVAEGEQRSSIVRFRPAIQTIPLS